MENHKITGGMRPSSAGGWEEREPINDGEEKVECGGIWMGECVEGGEEFAFPPGGGQGNFLSEACAR